MSEGTISVGVIGLGIMGRRMISSMTPHPAFTVTGAWDPSPEACRRAQAETSGLVVSAGAEELIADDATDLVYIACPPVWHKDYADLAMAAGKPVYCEKPLGVDLDVSRALVARFKKTLTPNVINFAQAASEAVEIAENRLRDGALGELTGIDINLHFSRWPRDWQLDADWLRLREQGGYAREVLSHFLYLVERLAGKAEILSATPVYPDDKLLCESHLTAVLKCGVVPVVVQGSSGGSGPDRVEMTLWGNQASLRLHDWFCLQSSDGGDWVEELGDLDALRPQSFRRQLDQVARWMAGEEHVLPDAEAALSVQELIEDILIR